MEEGLEVYHRPADPRHPVECLDEATNICVRQPRRHDGRLCAAFAELMDALRITVLPPPPGASMQQLVSAEPSSPAMETMQARFVPANSGLEVSIPGGFDYPVDKLAVEIRHVDGMFLDVDSLGRIRLRPVKLEIVIIADRIKHKHILADAFFRDIVLGLGDLEGPFGVRNGQNAQTMHHRRFGHGVVVGIMDETVLRIIAFESFPLIDIDALHESPISDVVLQITKLMVNRSFISHLAHI
jgi:hypothetical protein